MDRLVKLFKNADDDSIWVRVPVINYLRACPLPEAKQHIEELAKIALRTWPGCICTGKPWPELAWPCC